MFKHYRYSLFTTQCHKLLCLVNIIIILVLLINVHTSHQAPIQSESKSIINSETSIIKFDSMDDLKKYCHYICWKHPSYGGEICHCDSVSTISSVCLFEISWKFVCLFFFIIHP